MLATIGLEASVTWNKGDIRHTPKGRALEGVYDQSFAVFPLLKNDDGWLSESIVECINRLKHARDFFARIKGTGGRAELFVGWFLSQGGGDTLSSALLLEVSSLGLDLSFDVYPADASGKL